MGRRDDRSRHSLHNYFLVKSLALTRPGGVVVALTSLVTDSMHEAMLGVPSW